MKELSATEIQATWIEGLKKTLNIESDEKLNQIFKVYKSDNLDFNPLSYAGENLALTSFPESAIAIKHEQVGKVINAAQIHNAGGGPVDEICYCLRALYEQREQRDDFSFLMAHDAQLFLQIAKLRALRFLLEKINEQKFSFNFNIISETSESYFTNYESSTNMLRNTLAISAGLMGGANKILVENYMENTELLNRQVLNSFHVLNEESLLRQVKDPARGSEFIEGLTAFLVDKSFTAFCHVESKDFKEFEKDLSIHCEENFLSRREEVECGEKTLVGINNYTDSETGLPVLHYFLSNELFPTRHPHERIEKLRINAHERSFKIGLRSFGQLDRTYGRINFAKNIFEVLGKPVDHVHLEKFELKVNNESAIVLCAPDEDYPKLLEKLTLPKGIPVFVISRDFQDERCINVFKGVNIFDLLNDNLVVGVQS